jgi:hypothetical protein
MPRAWRATAVPVARQIIRLVQKPRRGELSPASAACDATACAVPRSQREPVDLLAYGQFLAAITAYLRRKSPRRIGSQSIEEELRQRLLGVGRPARGGNPDSPACPRMPLRPPTASLGVSCTPHRRNVAGDRLKGCNRVLASDGIGHLGHRRLPLAGTFSLSIHAAFFTVLAGNLSNDAGPDQNSITSPSRTWSRP